jgi:probable HAF family extracellular repeat protein
MKKSTSLSIVFLTLVTLAGTAVLMILPQVNVEMGARYKVRDLSELGGIQTEVHSFEGQDRFAGKLIRDGSPGIAFEWTQEGGLVELGTLGGVESWGTCLGPQGRVVGTSGERDAPLRAFLWTSEAGMRDLGTLGGKSSEGLVWVAGGGVTGRAEVEATGTYHAFHWTEEAGMRDLGTLGGKDSCALVGNTHGTIVGWSHGPGNYLVHATVWDSSGRIRELPDLGGEESQAIGINEAGYIAGWAESRPRLESACVWDPQANPRALQSLHSDGRSRAFSINAHNQVVGWSEDEEAGFLDVLENLHPNFRGRKMGLSRAVIWTEEKALDLNRAIDPDAGWMLVEALGISDQGIILARGLRSDDSRFRSCLLVPLESE